MSPPTRTLLRLERLLTMVPWLLEHPGVELAEVARRFGGDRAELARDLDMLGYCGLPGYGGGDLIEASVVGDRVVVRMADFFRRPLRLSLREAVTLLLAGRALLSVGLVGSEPLVQAVDKLERALGVQPGVAVDLSGPGDEHLPLLWRAAEERRVLHLVYRSASKGETTERDVEPWEVAGAGGAWYLRAWCRAVEAARDFRLDRIRSVRPTGERFADRPRPQAEPPAYRPRPDDTTVVLDLRQDAWWLAEWLRVDHVDDRGDVRRATFRARELEGIARLVLRLGVAATVVTPGVLSVLVRDRAREALALYDEDPGGEPQAGHASCR